MCLNDYWSRTINHYIHKYMSLHNPKRQKNRFKIWAIGFIKPKKTVAFLGFSIFLLVFFRIFFSSNHLSLGKKNKSRYWLPAIPTFIIHNRFWHFKKPSLYNQVCTKFYIWNSVLKSQVTFPPPPPISLKIAGLYVLVKIEAQTSAILESRSFLHFWKKSVFYFFIYYFL